MTEVLELDRLPETADEPRFVTVKLELPNLESVECHFLAKTAADQDRIRGMLVPHEGKSWGEVLSLPA